jgi:hypothetical protein
LAISPNPNTYDFDWHYNTTFHSSAQITFLANQFISFLESFELNVESSPLELCEKWFQSQNKIKTFEANFDKDAFTKKLENHLNVEQRKIHDNLSEYFKTSINRIWIYGDKHENMIPVICAAWRHHVEVLTINEKESSSFLDKLLEFKKEPSELGRLFFVYQKN